MSITRLKPIAIVTGTGSSGTTFLIGLCGELGLCNLDGVYVNDNIGGGYEKSYTNTDYTEEIYKDPRIFFGGLECTKRDLFSRGRKLDFAFICHRNYHQASLSRIARKVVFSQWLKLKGCGATAYEAQIDFFRKGLEECVTEMLRLNIEMCFVDYDRLQDPLYCFDVLSKRFPSLSKDDVIAAHKKIYKPDMKHSY